MEAPKIPKDLSRVSTLRKQEYYRKQLIWARKCSAKVQASIQEWHKTLFTGETYQGSLKFDALADMEATQRLEIIRKAIPVTCRPPPRIIEGSTLL